MKTASKRNSISTAREYRRIRVAVLLLGFALLMSALSGCGKGDTTSDTTPAVQSNEAQTDSPPESLVVPPKIIFTPSENDRMGQYPGYAFRVLERSGCTDSLSTADAVGRMDYVGEQTGALIEVFADPDPVNKVEKAGLSGASGYDALFLPLTDLSSLLRSGSLEDLAELGIDPASSGLNTATTESLAIKGKYYIAFGDISPVSVNSEYALLCNLPAALSNEINAIFGQDIRSATLTGELTIEKLLRACTDAELITASTSTDTVLCLPADGDGLAPTSLLTAMGGEIFDMSASPPRLTVEDGSFASAYSKALQLSGNAESDGSAVFVVQKFSKTGDEQCYLPIPKADENSPYRCLADPGGTYGWSVPLGAESGKRTRDITCALFEGSDFYATKYFADATGNEMEAAIAELIFSSGVCSVALLYDWGDFVRMTSDGIMNCTNLSDILGDSTYAKKASAAAAAIEIFTERLR